MASTWLAQIYELPVNIFFASLIVAPNRGEAHFIRRLMAYTIE
jgi:hypothetical protein